MSDLTLMPFELQEVTGERTPDVIATEIKRFHHYANTVAMTAAVEIGKRLCEAKELVEHGGWMKWLEEKVNYSQSTANNLMKLYHEYGSGEFATLGNLSYTKALALIAVPAEEREQFAIENDAENKSARELDKLVKEKKELERRAKEAEEAAEKERQAREKIEKLNQERAAEVERLQAQLKKAEDSGSAEDIDRLQKQLEQAENERVEAQNAVKRLEKELKAKPIDVPAVVEKVPDTVLAELEELRSQVAKQQNETEAEVKFGVCFEELVNRFSALLDAIDLIPDDEGRDKRKEAVIKLIGAMSERLV